MYDQDPQNDLYELLDRAGLIPSVILTARQPTHKTVNEIRTKLVHELKKYIEEREERHGSKAQSKKEKHIDIKVPDGQPEASTGG